MCAVFICVFVLMVFNMTFISSIKDIEKAGFEKYGIGANMLDSLFEDKEKRNKGFKDLDVGDSKTIRIDGELYNIRLVGTVTTILGDMVGIFEFDLSLAKETFKISERDFNF